MVLKVTKWYLDLCTDDGAVIIAYAARIRWRRLRLSYSATLELEPSGQVRERTTLRQFEEPRSDGDLIRWRQKALGVEASWRPLRRLTPTESDVHTLLETPAGQVSWKLLSGRAEVDWRGRQHHCGLGYIEKLELTLPPWDLPIDELRWGRFVAPDQDAVWIEWKGDHPLRLSWRNGQSVEAKPFVAAPRLDAPEADREAPRALGLQLTDSRLLRDGPLVSTVFSKVPVLRRALPARMLEATETKWCSRGVPSVAGPGQAPGWAIHEVVRWKVRR